MPDDERLLIDILKVHLAVADFRRYRNPKQKYGWASRLARKNKRFRYKMDALEWDASFDRAIAKWLDLARVKAFARVELACQLDAQVSRDVR